MTPPFYFDFAAAATAPLFGRKQLHPAALRALDESAAREDRWLVAFSGGADSLAVLLETWALWPTQRARLFAVHFNHGLRGEESETDQLFCEAICKNLGIVFKHARWINVPGHASEDEARQARFAFFSETARTENGQLLLTGHHQNDVVETHLMRLSRGSSSAGLAAPRPVRGWEEVRQIIRPLLNLSAEKIRAMLTERGVIWREDTTNQQDVFLRNRLRNSVVPVWLQATGKGALEGASLTREWLEEDDAALESWLDELGIEKAVTRLNLQLLAAKPRALRRRALRRWIYSAQLSRAGFNELIFLSERGAGQMSVGSGFAVNAKGWLAWNAVTNAATRTWTGVSMAIGASVFFPNSASLSSAWITPDPTLRERFQKKAVDASRESFVSVLDPVLYIRPWNEGDRYRPLGLKGSTKLQDLFVNRKIDARSRHQIPVICGSDDRIIWVPGFPPAEHSKITPDSLRGVQLTYIPGTSTV